MMDKAIESRDCEQLINAVKELANHWLCESEDREYYQAIVDGHWPTAEEILTQSLEKIREKKQQKIRLRAYEIYADRGYTTDPVADWLQAEREVQDTFWF